MTSPIHVLIAAGGTGGHIAPALALGQAVMARYEGNQVTTVCGPKPFEAEMYRRAGFEPVVIAGRPLLFKQPVALARGVWSATQAVRKCLKLLRRERPDVVVGMGGYVAAPMIAAARLLRIPVCLHEQNAVPGRANRLLSKFADGVSAAYPSALESMRGRSQQVLPNPLLAEIFMAEREDGIDAFGLDPDRPVIFVMGGSQGAEALNRAVFEAAQKVQQTFPKEYCPQLLWATGPRNFDEWSAKVGGHDGLESVLKLHPFIRSIEAAWACADLAIVRGGAGTLAELAATGTPGLVVPYPFARDLHQHKNAAPYEEAGAIRVIDESGLSSDLLARQITELFTQPRKLLKMSLAAGGLAPVGAADQMADWVLQVLQQRTGATVRFEKPSSPSKPVPPRLPGSTNVAHATPS